MMNNRSTVRLQETLIRKTHYGGCELMRMVINDSVRLITIINTRVLSLGDQYLRRLKVTGATKSYNTYVLLTLMKQ